MDDMEHVGIQCALTGALEMQDWTGMREQENDGQRHR